MIPPLMTALEDDEENILKKLDGGMDGWRYGSLKAVISRAPVELISIHDVFLMKKFKCSLK